MNADKWPRESRGRREQTRQPISGAEYRRYLVAVTLFHQAAAEATGLWSMDYQASNLLDLDGPLSSGELARRLGISTGATTRLVDRLVEAGIAERTHDPADRRRALIAHTGRNPSQLEEILGRVREPLRAALESLTPEQLTGVSEYVTAATAVYQEQIGNLRTWTEKST